MRRYNLILIAIASFHVVLLAYSAAWNAPSVDELGHIAASAALFSYGRPMLYEVNPPLLHIMTSIPLYLTGECVIDLPEGYDALGRIEFQLGSELVDKYPDLLGLRLFIIRVPSIIISLGGLYICQLWARALFGVYSGLCAASLWAFSPSILGSAPAVMNDVWCASLCTFVMYYVWRWLFVDGSSLIVGPLLGLAICTKFTALTLLLAIPALVLLRFGRRSNRATLPSFAQFLTVSLSCLLVMNLIYNWSGSFVSIKECTLQSKLFSNILACASPTAAQDAWQTTFESFVLPFPRGILSGVDKQIADFEISKWSYLRGEHRLGGWWYYSLYAIVIKEPVGTWAIIFASLFFAVCSSAFRSTLENEICLMVAPVVFMLALSCADGFSRYHRYCLPILPFLFIFASRIFTDRASYTSIRWLGVVLLLSTVIAVLHVYPFCHSYFNGFVGGPLKGQFHLLDANIDWGQDTFRLERWVERHPETWPVRVAGVQAFKLRHLDPTGLRLIDLKEGRGLGNGTKELPPGWYAISVNRLFAYPKDNQFGDAFECWQELAPFDRVGYSVYIYKMEPKR